MNDLYFILLAVSFAAVGAAILYFAFRYFEVSVFLMLFSSWVPYIFHKNSHEGILEEQAGIGSYIRIILILSVGVVGIIKFIQFYPKHKARIPVHFVLLAAFIVFTFITILYSIDPQITFIRSATFTAFFLFLLGFYAWMREEEFFYKAMNVLYYLTVLFIVLSALGMILTPDRVWWWYTTSRFIGIWGHPNTTGMFCLTAYPVLLWKFNESNNYGKILISAFFIFVLFMHIITGSRTSLLASAVGLSIWFIAQRKALKFVIAAAVVAFGLLVLIQVRPQSFERGESQDITDVTGRDEMWKGAVTLIEEKPLTGYGYSVEGKVWQDPRFFREGYGLWEGNNRASLHNGYLSIAIGVGVPGFILWMAILFIPLFLVLRIKSSPYKAFALSIMVMMLLANFSESSLDSASSIGAIYFWIAWTFSTKLRELEQEETETVRTEVLEESYAA